MSWTLTDVGVTYRLDDGSHVEALRGVSISLEPGERIAIVGCNGSGKSTLAKVLAGVITPSTGSLRRAGEIAATKDFGALVLQNPADNIIGESLREEIELTLGESLEGECFASIMGVLQRFGIAHLLERPSDKLSGGETQLAAMVCGLLSGRALVILDEPTSHLDPPSRDKLITRLLSDPLIEAEPLWQSVTVIFVTQYQHEARGFPRVIELDQGHICYDGEPNGWAGIVDSDCASEWSPLTEEHRTPILITENLAQSGASPSDGANSLSAISLRVHEGDAIGLAGPIGSGKSTLAYHLAGLISCAPGMKHCPQSAESNAPPVVLIQFPERQLFSETTIDDVAFGPRNRGRSETESLGVARGCLSMVGLPDDQFGVRSPFSLSGGQKRRVSLAGVAACQTSIYILDEPTSALDSRGIACLEAHLREWNFQRIAYIVISHDIEWLRRVTTRAWVMSKGRMLADSLWTDSDCEKALEEIGFRSESLPSDHEKPLDFKHGGT